MGQKTIESLKKIESHLCKAVEVLRDPNNFDDLWERDTLERVVRQALGNVVATLDVALNYKLFDEEK